MVVAAFDPAFQKVFSKLKDPVLKEKILKQVKRLKGDPELGKPMRYERKGTRDAYVKPFRLSYAYLPEEDKIIFLDLYHKDEQ